MSALDPIDHVARPALPWHTAPDGSLCSRLDGHHPPLDHRAGDGTEWTGEA